MTTLVRIQTDPNRRTLQTVHACYLGPTFLGKNGTYAEQFVGAVLRHVVAKSLGDALEQCAILQGDYLRCLWLKLSGGRDFLRNCLDSAHATPQGPQQQAVVTPQKTSVVMPRCRSSHSRSVAKNLPLPEPSTTSSLA